MFALKIEKGRPVPLTAGWIAHELVDLTKAFLSLRKESFEPVYDLYAAFQHENRWQLYTREKYDAAALRMICRFDALASYELYATEQGLAYYRILSEGRAYEFLRLVPYAKDDPLVMPPKRKNEAAGDK